MVEKRSVKVLALAIFAGALLIRLIVAFWVNPWFVSHGYRHWSWEWNDGYDALARNLVEGRGYSLDGTHP
ncbi:MAG TPA: hypothetical protein ENF73_00740, partial [Proteobacteria bacterium]|nr:hypothetical protein [Pseudomonadota bacterium]